MLISPEHLLIQIETAMDNDPRMPIDRRVKEGIIIRDRFMSSESKEQQNVFNITFYYFLAGKLASWNSDHRLDRQILECYIMMLRFCVSVRDYGTMEDVWEEITDFYLQISNLTYGEIETKVPGNRRFIYDSRLAILLLQLAGDIPLLHVVGFEDPCSI